MNAPVTRTRKAVGGSAPEPLAHELMETVGRLRRSARRIVRRDWPYRPLTDSEAELVRFVARRPGDRVREAAQALGVAENTISTLVGRLVDRGLLERRRDRRDARAASLRLTPAAARRIAEYRDRRAEVVGATLASLAAEDRRSIEAALPALRRLVDALEER